VLESTAHTKANKVSFCCGFIRNECPLTSPLRKQIRDKRGKRCKRVLIYHIKLEEVNSQAQFVNSRFAFCRLDAPVIDPAIAWTFPLSLHWRFHTRLLVVACVVPSLLPDPIRPWIQRHCDEHAAAFPRLGRLCDVDSCQ
jgi:hypothetical protein